MSCEPNDSTKKQSIAPRDETNNGGGSDSRDGRNEREQVPLPRRHVPGFRQCAARLVEVPMQARHHNQREEDDDFAVIHWRSNGLTERRARRDSRLALYLSRIAPVGC